MTAFRSSLTEIPMKNFKKIAALALSAVMCLGLLTACGNKDDKQAGSGR